MATQHTCDLCGDPIEDRLGEIVNLMAVGGGLSRAYHAGTCWGLVSAGAIDGTTGSRPQPQPMTPDVYDEWTDPSNWRRTPPATRERWTLEGRGDERLTTTQVAERLQEKVGPFAVRPDCARVVLKRLIEAGEVHRTEVADYRGGAQPRWLYFRNAELRGPIADLERMLDESNEREAS